MPNHVTNIVKINAAPDRIEEILKTIQNDEDGIGSIDFSKLRPMPESLKIESGATTNDCINLYLTAISPFNEQFLEHRVSSDEYFRINKLFNNRDRFTKFHDGLTADEVNEKVQKLFEYSADDFKSVEDIFSRAKTALNNIEQYGNMDWYDWGCANWGTKWNAYTFGDFKDGSDTITFETAWGAPHPILELLSEKYPDAEFTHSWADEDLGQNVGKRVYKNGELIDSDIPNAHSVEAYEMAADIKGECLEDRGLYISDDGQNYEYREDEYEDAEKEPKLMFRGEASHKFFENTILASSDTLRCAAYDEPRTFDWCEENCPKYSSCDTIAWAEDESKLLNGEVWECAKCGSIVNNSDELCWKCNSKEELI